MIANVSGSLCLTIFVCVRAFLIVPIVLIVGRSENNRGNDVVPFYASLDSKTWITNANESINEVISYTLPYFFIIMAILIVYR